MQCSPNHSSLLPTSIILVVFSIIFDFFYQVQPFSFVYQYIFSNSISCSSAFVFSFFRLSIFSCNQKEASLEELSGGCREKNT